MVRAGGRHELEKGVEEGRNIKSCVGGMPMFFFPTRKYSRENLYRQQLQGQSTKQGNMEELMKVQQDQWGFSWEPSKLIGSARGPWSCKFPG